MKGLKSKVQALVGGMLAFLLALGVFAALPVGAAYADQAAVRDTANGVMKFNWWMPSGGMPQELIEALGIDPNKAYSRGSCFLINEDTVVTAYHNTFFSTEELDNMDKLVDIYNTKHANQINKIDRRWLREHITYTVNVNRDMQIGATLVNRSEEQDFAIFKLDQSIAGYTPLKFRDSTKVEAAEPIYSVGFPANSDLTAIHMYTPSDATIKGGTVSKSEELYQGNAMGTTGLGGFKVNGYFIQSDCTISGGDSGGPMVDADGNVVGISVVGDGNYYLAVGSDKVMQALDTLKIKYDRIDGPIDKKTDDKTGTESGQEGDTYSLNTTQLSGLIENAKKIKADEYTDESYKALQEAINKAADIRDNAKLDDKTDKAEYEKKQAEIDAAIADLNTAMDADHLVKKPASVLPSWAIIAIIVGVAAIVGIIIAIVMINKNKKKAADQAQAQNQMPGGNAGTATPSGAANQAAPAPSQQAPVAPSTPPVQDSPATTVLDEGSEGTTVLGEQINGGTLTRMSNNEQIAITRSDMTIGRESRSVDYCLSGNGNIGRIHARIVVRDGNVYVVDNNSTNGTYVNNTKLRSGQEQVLRNNDIVRFADEKFRYTS